MSKAQLLKIQHINFFPNVKEQVTFLTGGKNEDGSLKKVQADFSAWDKEAGYDMKAINAHSATGMDYMRVAITLGEGADRTFYNGALFVNKKRATNDSVPDFTGTLDLVRDRNAPKLSLVAWKKTGRDNGTKFMTLVISDPQNAQASAAASATPPADNASNSAPLDDDIPFGY